MSTDSQQAQHDLLIRLDAQQENLAKKLDNIELILLDRKCATHAEKLRTHDKFIWGSFGASVAALIKSFWTT